MKRLGAGGRIQAIALALALALAAPACAPPRVARSPEPTPEGIVFRYRAPSARIVQLAGSWADNAWLAGSQWTRDTRVGAMQGPDSDGLWQLTVELPAGRYEYAFLVDGTFWEADPQNPERVPDGQGGARSLLVVP